MALFRNKVFTDVNNLRQNHAELEWVLNSMAGILIRRETFGHKDTQRKNGHTVMAA